MASYNKFNAFVADLANKVHNLGSDQLTIALTAAANAPVATNSVLADLTEISYTNLSTRNIITTSSTQSAGLYKLILTNLTLTASGTVATFRYVVVYNSTTASKNLIAWFDYASNLTLNSGDALTVAFDGTNGLFTLQ